MENLDRWGFDAFRVDALTNHRPLTAVTFTVLQVSNFTLQKATTKGMCVEHMSVVSGWSSLWKNTPLTLGFHWGSSWKQDYNKEFIVGNTEGFKDYNLVSTRKGTLQNWFC